MEGLGVVDGIDGRGWCGGPELAEEKLLTRSGAKSISHLQPFLVELLYFS